MRVSEIRVKRIRVNQGLGVDKRTWTALNSRPSYFYANVAIRKRQTHHLTSNDVDPL